MQRLRSLEGVKGGAFLSLVFLAVQCLPQPAFCDDEHINEQVVRVQVSAGRAQVTLRGAADFVLEHADEVFSLPPGAYSLGAEKIHPAKERFHVFTRTFEPDEREAEREYLRHVRRRGFRPKVVVIGKRFTTDTEMFLETRVRWISLARFETRSKAEAMRRNLEAREDQSWIQREIDKPGRGSLVVTAELAPVLDAISLPVTIRSTSPVSLEVPGQKSRMLSGDLEVSIGADGAIEVVEALAVEAYLAGVLPAEMPPLWPIEALKAQAVAARSEVLASIATKHSLEGYDFCSEVHCRAYLGSGDSKVSTSRAIRETNGEILVQGVRIVPTVFSSTCGGWTENNDTVWYGPANSALRGVADGGAVVALSPSPQNDIHTWLAEAGSAFCGQDSTYFRWERVYSGDELSTMVNRLHSVGQIETIELGERGVSGRLKWVRIIGSKSTATIQKELSIRRALGSLPSALFVLDSEKTQEGPRRFTFTGAGRGHGVGLCQNGARGMAHLGMLYLDILGHYFGKADLLRYR